MAVISLSDVQMLRRPARILLCQIFKMLKFMWLWRLLLMPSDQTLGCFCQKPAKLIVLNMKRLLLLGCVLMVCDVSPVWAQSINVAQGSIDIGAAGSGEAGPLLQQTGGDTVFSTKDGENPAEVRMVIKADGKVGVGTDTPAEKLEVVGNSVTTGSATVGSLVVGSSTIFSEGFFESAEQPVQDNITHIVQHGLGGVPRFATVSLRCKKTQYGWAVGDEIMLNSVHMRSDNYGITTAVNATEIKVREHGPIWIHKANTSGLGALDWSCWCLVFRAWR